MRGRGVTVGLVLLCVLAGCNGFGGQDATASEETVTPAPVPTVETQPAEGVSEDGINAPAVAANHRAALVDRSYTSRTQIRWQDANGTIYTETTVHRVEAGGQRFHVIAVYARPRGDANLTGHELYHDGNQTFLRVANAAGEEQLQRIEDNPAIEYSGRGRSTNCSCESTRRRSSESTVVTPSSEGRWRARTDSGPSRSSARNATPR
jgi:hypothetical protein